MKVNVKGLIDLMLDLPENRERMFQASEAREVTLTHRPVPVAFSCDRTDIAWRFCDALGLHVHPKIR